MKVIKITDDGDEITRYGFISHMEHYLRQLLSDPMKASVGDYLMSHGINNEEMLPLLLANPDKSDENNAILIRAEKIKTDPETGKDKFCVKYKMPRKDFDKKMRNLFINLFENYQTENNMLNEDGEGCGCAMCSGGEMPGLGGATTCGDSSGAFVQPLYGKKRKDGKKETTDSTSIIRRTMPGLVSEKKNKTVIIREEQLKALAEAVECDTAFGDFGYDAPASVCRKSDPSLDHKDIMKKSFPGYSKKKPE